MQLQMYIFHLGGAIETSCFSETFIKRSNPYMSNKTKCSCLNAEFYVQDRICCGFAQTARPVDAEAPAALNVCGH